MLPNSYVLHAESGCWALWELSDDDEPGAVYSRDIEAVNVDSRDLPISDALKSRISQWESVLKDCDGVVGDQKDQYGFDLEGVRIWKQLRTELPNYVSVAYRTTYIQEGPEAWRVLPGGLYLVPMANATFGVVKVIELDAAGIHMRRYPNIFKYRPTWIIENNLTVVTLSPWGANHRPSDADYVVVTEENWAEFRPTFVQRSVVSDDEYADYRYWSASPP